MSVLTSFVCRRRPQGSAQVSLAEFSASDTSLKWYNVVALTEPPRTAHFHFG